MTPLLCPAPHVLCPASSAPRTRLINREMQIEKLESIKSVAADTRGKHRVLAELKRLEQETHHLEIGCRLALIRNLFTPPATQNRLPPFAPPATFCSIKSY